MSNPLISIIIPIYNAEKFLTRSVGSALAQSGCDFEVILVDDGSPDNCGAICDGYAAENANVRVVHKKNGGLSSARNAGIAAASGEYLLFLDADDALEPDTCTLLSAVIRQHRPDCIDFGWSYISTKGDITANLHKVPKNTLLGKDTLRELILPPLLNLRKDDDHFVFDFSCTKSFCRELILKHHITFDEGRRTWEDRPFVVSYLRHCDSFYSIDRCLYRYVDVPSSLSRRYNMDFFRIILENFQLYRTLFGQDYDFDTVHVNNHWSRAIEEMIFRSLAQKENRAAIRSNILQTLGDPQVIHWFANRTPQTHLQNKAGALIVGGQPKKALGLYQRKVTANTRRQFISDMNYYLRQGVKKLIGR